MRNKARLKKIEKAMSYKEDILYVIDPFAAKGEEVIVYCNKERSIISREEFDLLDVDDNLVTDITIEFV